MSIFSSAGLYFRHKSRLSKRPLFLTVGDGGCSILRRFDSPKVWIW